MLELLFPQASAAIYSLSGSATTALGTAASDTSTSIIGVVADILPVMIPVIVVWFAVGLIRSFLHK